MPSTEFETASRRVNHHQSSVELTLGCPRRAAIELYSTIELPARLQAAAGTAFHWALAGHETARLEGNPDGITREAMKELAAESLAEMDGTFDAKALAELTHTYKAKGKDRSLDDVRTGMDALLAQAHDAVDNWWDAPITDPAWLPDPTWVATEEEPEQVPATTTCREWLMRLTPLAIEQYVKAPLLPGSRELAGTVDGIYWDPALKAGAGGVRLVDAKTAGKSGMSSWKRPGEHRHQATFYSVLSVLDQSLSAIDERLPVTEMPPLTNMVVRRELGTRSNFIGALLLEIQPGQPDVPILADRIRKTEQLLADGRFLPDPTYQFCKSWSCPVFDRCLFGDKSLAGPVSSLGPLQL